MYEKTYQNQRLLPVQGDICPPTGQSKATLRITQQVYYSSLDVCRL